MSNVGFSGGHGGSEASDGAAIDGAASGGSAAPLDGSRSVNDLIETTPSTAAGKDGVALEVEEWQPRQVRKELGYKVPVVSQGTPFEYPRESMTDAERADFLEVLRPSVERLYERFGVVPTRTSSDRLRSKLNALKHQLPMEELTEEEQTLVRVHVSVEHIRTETD